MYHKLWTFGNLLLIVVSTLYIWFFRPHENSIIITSQLLAQTALLLFLTNVNMYFVFLVIRKTSKREMKIKLAKFSRQLMKWHIKLAMTGTIFVLGHASINIQFIGPLVGYTHIKMVTGYVAIIMLISTLLAGYLRSRKASGFRKKFHRTIAIIFSLLFFLHMFIFL